MSIAAFPRFEIFSLGKERDRRKFGKKALSIENTQANTKEAVNLTPNEVHDLFISIRQAEIELENSKDLDDLDAHKQYMGVVGEVDKIIGNYAETVLKQGASKFDEKGKNGTLIDPVSKEPLIWSPHDIYELDNAIKIYERTRSENSKALVEALLVRYSDPTWWHTTKQLKKRYEELQQNLTERPQTLASSTLS